MLIKTSIFSVFLTIFKKKVYEYSLMVELDNKYKIGEKRFREARYARLNRKKPSPTIVTGSRMYYHPTENRFLTTREAASLQSFPANFEFMGSNTSQWTQIGNAVPVNLGYHIGRCVIAMLDGNFDNKSMQIGEKWTPSNQLEIFYT